jgi:uncharacterized protein (DUF362 family)
MPGRKHHLSRRDLGRAGAGLVVSPWALSLAGCADEDGPAAWNDQRVAGAEQAVLALYPRAVVPSGEEAVQRACRNLDFSWLAAGDSVLVKVASNSPNPHPASTSPAAVRGLVPELFARGAGRVVVAEQCGVEYVRLAPGDTRFSSTSERLAENGLYQAIVDSGAEPHFFDDQGFDDGYFEATLPEGAHWTQPLYLPRILEEVDHVVYLPRLSAHVLAGYTLGLKLAVGWLRDDSRYQLHHEAEAFYEKYAEISYTAELADRVRLVLTLAESLLLDFGPDTGTVFEADPRIVIASQSLTAHEAVAATVLVHADAVVEAAPGAHYDPASADALNQAFVESWVPDRTGIPWGPAMPTPYAGFTAHAIEQGIGFDRALARAWELEGGAPSRIDALVTAEPPTDALREFFTAHTDGVVLLS